MTYEELILDRVRVHRVAQFSADVVEKLMLPHVREHEMMLMLEEDAYQKRYTVDCFGKTEAWVVKVPASWWQHLKLALRARWPSLFRRLRVQQKVLQFDSGWVAPELRMKVAAKHLVIPYVTDPYTYNEKG